jgi:hypothetical protein
MRVILPSEGTCGDEQSRRDRTITFPSLTIFGKVPEVLPRKTPGFRLIGRPSPRIVFGKVPRWHSVTASLPPGHSVGPSGRIRGVGGDGCKDDGWMCEELFPGHGTTRSCRF